MKTFRPIFVLNHKKYFRSMGKSVALPTLALIQQDRVILMGVILMGYPALPITGPQGVAADLT